MQIGQVEIRDNLTRMNYFIIQFFNFLIESNFIELLISIIRKVEIAA